MSVSSGRYRSSLPKLSRARVVKVTGPLEWAHISYSAKNRPTSLHKQRELFKSMLRAEWHPEENVLSQTRWTVYVGSTCGHHERVPESALLKILRVPSIYVSVLSTQTAYWILRQATHVLLMRQREVPQDGLWKFIADFRKKECFFIYLYYYYY